MEDYKANKRNFSYKKGRETKKITHFWSPNKEAYGKKRKRKKKKRKEERNQANVWIFGVWYGI